MVSPVPAPSHSGRRAGGGWRRRGRRPGACPHTEDVCREDGARYGGRVRGGEPRPVVVAEGEPAPRGPSLPGHQYGPEAGEQLDKALKDSGITFSGDIQPWLGAQVGLAVRIPQGNADPPVALFAVSKDDSKAVAALTKLRAGSQGKKYVWRDTTYGGITITVGSPTISTKPTTGSLKAGAYAIVDHVVVIASSEAVIREVIDADQGRSARLVESADYKATLAKVPSDRLALVYVNGQSVVSHLKSQLTTPLAANPAGIKGLGDAEAFQGAALALSARPDGIVADAAVRLDAGKLSASTRGALTHAGHAAGVIGWIPSSSDAFFAFASLDRTIQSTLDP